MKNLFKTMMLVAVAAMGFTACSKDVAEEVNPEVQTITRELIVSAEKPVLEGDTRTEFNGETVVWSTGDAIRMVYQSENGWSTKFYASKNAVIEGNKATFAVNTEFSANDGGNYQFYAGYPTKQWNGGNTNYSKEGTVSVEIPTEQTMPSANTFDSKGDLLIGKSVATYATIPATGESMNFNYTRLVSHACVTLKNFVAVEGEKVLNVTFTAPAEVYLTGSSTADFEAQALTEDFGNNTVTVNLPENEKPAATGNVDVWFCSAPATIGKGENLIVEVETTRGTYTRTITAREGGIQFPQNKYSTLGINMASAEFVAATVESLEVTGATTAFTTEDEFEFDGTVTATLSNGYEQDVTALATVDSSKVVMTTAGTYTITVSYGGKETSYEVTVQDASVQAQKVTITFDGGAGSANKSITWTSDPITVVADKASGSNNPNEHAKDKELRFYAKNTLTISGATITKIEFTFKTEQTFSVSTGTYSNRIWAGSAESVTFTNTATSQAKIESVTITYLGAGGGGETPDPTPDPEEPTPDPEEPETPGEGEVILREEFDNTSSTESNAAIGQNVFSNFNGATAKAYKDEWGGLKLGTGSAVGYITSKALDLSKPFTVTLDACKYKTNTSEVSVTVNGVTKTITNSELPNGGSATKKTFTLEFEAATSNSTIKISTTSTGKRANIDNVVVAYQ